MLGGLGLPGKNCHQKRSVKATVFCHVLTFSPPQDYFNPLSFFLNYKNKKPVNHPECVWV